MATRDSLALLTLLGHEMRAPAGVVGGYLTMIGRHPLSAEQTRALDGARRAQQALVEILDDVHRLVEVWREVPTTARPLPITDVLDRTLAACAAGAVDLDVAIHPGADLSVTADRDVLVQALTALATTVAREHGSAVVCDVAREGPGRAHAFVLLTFQPQARDAHAVPRRVDLHHLRPGLGLRLVVAVEHLRQLGAEAFDLVSGDRPAGIELRLPVV